MEGREGENVLISLHELGILIRGDPTCLIKGKNENPTSAESNVYASGGVSVTAYLPLDRHGG